MKLERLVKMANNIGDYFNSETDKEIAAEGIKNHLLRTWEPRMRKAIIAYCQEDGAELSSLVKAAVTKLAAG